jgi:hypothetical protein
MPTYAIQPSRVTDITQAIFTLGTSGPVTFNSSKMGDVPTPDELSAKQRQPQAGYPWFSVREPRFVGFAVGAELQTGQAAKSMHGMQGVEPVWEYDIYMLWPYSQSNTNLGVAATAMGQMFIYFGNNYTLSNTCAVSNVHSPEILYLVMGNTELTAVKMCIQAFEILQSTYS